MNPTFLAEGDGDDAEFVSLPLHVGGWSAAAPPDPRNRPLWHGSHQIPPVAVYAQLASPGYKTQSLRGKESGRIGGRGGRRGGREEWGWGGAGEILGTGI